MSNAVATDLDAAIELAAQWVSEAERLVVFTGAGVSTESGIPDFRSPGGIWEKYDPRELTYQKFLADPAVRKLRWKMFMEMEAMWDAKPNPAHLAVAELHKLGKLRAVITQNVDGLHQDAGVPAERVIELHGTNREVYCLRCGARWPSSEIRERIAREKVEIPDCVKCGGILKTATVSFGQAMPEKETAEAVRLSEQADLMIVMGSTLVVNPAAMMPRITKENGGRVVIINLSGTEGDHYADLVVRGKAGELMPRIVERYKKNR
ncbi:MAG TPA: NAD-dependent deacylase [bacterium]|nr:NAD-dependent deacylase [bacterium]